MVGGSQMWPDAQALDFLTKHDDAAQLPVVARVTVLKRVGAFECEAAVVVPGGSDVGKRNRIVKKLHLLCLTLAAGSPHGYFMDTGALKPQPEKTAQDGRADDFKPGHDKKEPSAAQTARG
jgi:hypothetical protein